MRRRDFLLGGALAAAAGLGAWGVACGPTEIRDRRRQLLASWGQSALLGWYGETSAGAKLLGQRIDELCADPTAERLSAARQAWWDVRAPWKRAEVFAFGPYAEEPLRYGPKIDFWPVRPDNVEQVLAGTVPLSVESVGGLGAAARGLPVIEYLLHQPGVDVLSELAAAPRRCEYLRALAGDVAIQVDALAAAWDPAQGDYLSELTQAGRGSQTFMTLQMALGEVVNRMGFSLENIRVDKLGRPLGTTSGGVPQPDKAESPFSGRSLEDVRDNVRGIERLFFGAPGEPSLDGYLIWRGRKLAGPIRAALSGVYAALDAIGRPLTEAVTEDPAAVEHAIDAIGELQRAFQVDVLNALSVTVGFNDNDGD